MARMNLGEILKYHRERLGDTLEEVAFRAGTDASNLSRIERGVQQPSVSVLMNIAHALNVQLSTVFEQIEKGFGVLEDHQEWDEVSVQVLRVLKHLTPGERQLALELIRTVASHKKKGND